MGRVIREFLGDGITCLYLIGKIGQSGRTKLCAQDMIHMAAKCSNLEVLVIGCVRMESWPNPNETVPWTSLKQLSLMHVEMKTDLFSGVELHHSMPNLEVFSISVGNEDLPWDLPVALPEFQNCNNLKHISLQTVDTSAFAGQYLIWSLPRSLKRMDGCFLIPDYCWESLKKRYRDSLNFTVGWLCPGMELDVDWAPEWGDLDEDEDFIVDGVAAEADYDDEEEDDYEDFEIFEVDEVGRLKDDARRPLSPALLLHCMEVDVRDKGSDDTDEDYYDGALQLEASMRIFSSIDR